MHRVVVLMIAFLPAVNLAAQSLYPSSPDWTSADTQVSTGAVLADLDRDGWPDLVVANGNDMATQHLAVYYNQGDGSLPTNPSWQSSDTAYNGHLDVADVNGDGWLDVAVAVLGDSDDYENAAKLYLNSSGTLSSTPDWQANELANAFGCAFGDVNNDGRPDLAVATGWSYSPQNSFPNYVYVNQGGSLPASASWSSSDQNHLQGMLWIDANNDGWLDLVGVASGAQTSIYTNSSGTLNSTATWHTTDSASQDAIMAAWGDVNGDGFRDLLVTDNSQLGGSGRTRLYAGLEGGYFATTYSWSYYVGYGSSVALADLDGDSDLDMVTGGWWDKVALFVNTGAGLPADPDWLSGPETVIEKIVFADVDVDGLRQSTEVFPADGRRLHCLAHRPLHDVLSVVVDGAALTPAEWVVDRTQAWLTTGLDAALETTVTYSWSRDLDMAVSNWDSTVGNHLYYDPLLFADGFESANATAWASSSGVVRPNRWVRCPDHEAEAPLSEP